MAKKSKIIVEVDGVVKMGKLQQFNKWMKDIKQSSTKAFNANVVNQYNSAIYNQSYQVKRLNSQYLRLNRNAEYYADTIKRIKTNEKNLTPEYKKYREQMDAAQTKYGVTTDKDARTKAKESGEELPSRAPTQYTKRARADIQYYSSLEKLNRDESKNIKKSKDSESKKLANMRDADNKRLGKTSVVLAKNAKATSKLVGKKNGIQRLSWGFTMMSLGALGVYFSMYGLLNMFSMMTGSLLGSLLNLDTSFDALAGTLAFAGEDGKELMKALTGEDSGDPTSFVQDLITAWQDVTGMVSMFKMVLMDLALKVFNTTDENGQTLIDTLKQLAIDLAEMIATNPEIVKGIYDIIIAFKDLAPKILEVIPKIAELITNLSESGLLGKMMEVAMYCIILMPLFSAIAYGLQFLGAIIKGVSILTGLFGGEVAVAGGTLATLGSRVSFLFGPIGILIGIIVTIITYFGWWDDIARVLGDTFSWLGDILEPVLNILGQIGEYLKVGGDILGQMLFGAEYTPSSSTYEELEPAYKSAIATGGSTGLGLSGVKELSGLTTGVNNNVYNQYFTMTPSEVNEALTSEDALSQYTNVSGGV